MLWPHSDCGDAGKTKELSYDYLFSEIQLRESVFESGFLASQ